jgi:hypothetical protein
MLEKLGCGVAQTVVRRLAIRQCWEFWDAVIMTSCASYSAHNILFSYVMKLECYVNVCDACYMVKLRCFNDKSRINVGKSRVWRKSNSGRSARYTAGFDFRHGTPVENFHRGAVPMEILLLSSSTEDIIRMGLNDWDLSIINRMSESTKIQINQKEWRQALEMLKRCF